MPRDIHPRLKLVPQPYADLDLAIEIFLTAKEARRCTPRTVANYRWYLEKFKEWLEARNMTDVESITAHGIRLFLAEVDKRGSAAGYTHTYAKIIKTWMRFLAAEEIIPADPMSNVEMPRLDKEILPAFTPEDVHKLLDACNGVRERSIVLCLIDTGCRAAELCALTVGDVDLKTGSVMVRQGKGRKDRMTFIGPTARKELLRYFKSRADTKPGDPLFPSATTGQPLKPNGLLLLLRRLGKRAGVEHCHPHTFRRTCALWSLRAGMNVYALQQIMGHSDLEVLRRYLALVEGDLADAHRQHGAVDSML